MSTSPSYCIQASNPGGGGVTESSASLYTGAESNPGDRVLGEVEKDSFIALPGKGEHTGLLSRKTMCPDPRGFDGGFYNGGSKVGSLTRA